MTQLSLLDPPHRRRTRARRTDPESSHRAADRAERMVVGSHRHRVVLDVATRPGLSGHPVIDANTTLIAAASDLAVALARVEWACLDVSDQPTICPACIGVREHFDRCPLDAALTKAGVTPELRARIRKGGA